MPLKQVPWPEQSSGHESDEQSNPVYPAAHSHWYAELQVPFDGPPQSFGHVRTSHSSPFQPGRHSHFPLTHLPW